MNKLEAVIIDQHRRVKEAGTDASDALRESQQEILSAATPELTLEIILSHKGYGTPEIELSSNAIMRKRRDQRPFTNRSTTTRTPVVLAQIGMVVPNQGYTGGIIFDGDESVVFGHSMAFGRINDDDPIQRAMGETFYPPMMWAKALRAEAYKNRPDSAYLLTVAEYMAKLGLSLGCMVSEQGDIVGATGFMPGPRLEHRWDDEAIEEHICSEPVEAFRLSGFCDQAVVNPYILTDSPRFAKSILELSGSLN